MTQLLDRLADTRPAVREIFAERIGRRRSPLAAYAVFQRSGLIYGEGISGLPGQVPPTLDSAFRIASCTKSFTAAAALVLRDRGQLSLDDPIDRHLRLGNRSAADGPMPTLGQLLSMNGGLPSDDPWADRQESMSDADFDTLIAGGLRFARRPGSGFEYSNLGYALVGRAIAQVAGKPYRTVVTEELLRPLGLEQISYEATVPTADGVVTGYRSQDSEWTTLPFSGPGAFSPIGGLFATPRALTVWCRWLAGADIGLAGADTVLSPQSRREMGTLHTAMSGPSSVLNGVSPEGYGYGLVVQNSLRHGPVLSHSGGYPGFGAHFRWHQESGIGIVALENATYSGPVTGAQRALALMLDETAVPDVEPQLWPETVAARNSIERLLREWDHELAAALFADNIEADESLPRRQESIAELARSAGIVGAPVVPLPASSPRSTSPAHLIWSSRGAAGSLRCEIRMTPQALPRVQTLIVKAG